MARRGLYIASSVCTVYFGTVRFQVIQAGILRHIFLVRPTTIVSHAILGLHIGPVDFCNGICTSRCVSGAQARCSTLCSWNVSWTRLGFERAPKVKRHHQNALRTSARYFGKSAPLRKRLLFREIAEFYRMIIKEYITIGLDRCSIWANFFIS